MVSLQNFYNESENRKNSPVMPVIFVGHGSPMNAIESNTFSENWKKLGESLQKPLAILSVSAHWLTSGSTKVTAMKKPPTIHDFGGFPRELYQMEYPAPGSPEFAEQTISLLRESHTFADHSWGLDHGTWSVLVNLFPEANVPVYQLSIDYSKAPEYHFELVKALRILRSKGVLLMGSGNIVHNLSRLSMNGESPSWSLEFDERVKKYIDQGDFRSVVDFLSWGNISKLAHPSHDHFLPLLYSLGMASPTDEVKYFNEGFDLGSISMRSLILENKI